MNIQRQRILANAGIFIFTLLVALIGLEMMLKVSSFRQMLGLPNPGHYEWRTSGFHRKDPELIYSLQPDYRGQWKEAAFTVQVSTNSLGLRGREPGPRDSGSKRILILGDSMVFGWGANDDETFPKRLEDLLNTSVGHFEVINAGVVGYGTDQYYAFFTKRLAKLKPDLLIFCLFENDLINNIQLPLYSVENGALTALAVENHPVYLLGRLQEIIPAFIRKTATYRILATVLLKKYPYDLLPGRDMDALKAWSREKAMLQLASLQERAEQEGFHLLVVGLPYKIGKYTDAGFYAFIEEQTDVAVELLDLSRLPVWHEQQASLFMQGGDPHTNLSGYQLIAELLAEHLHGNSADYFGNQ